MSNIGIDVPDVVTGADLDAIVTLLLGGEVGYSPRDPGLGAMPNWVAGLLRRAIQSTPGDPVGPGQQITPTAVSTLKVPDPATSCILSVEVQALRITFDETVPTASAGLLVPVSTLLTLTGVATMKGAQFIQAVAGTVVDVQYFT